MASQDQSVGLADDAIELDNLIFHGGIAFCLDIDQLLR